MRTLQPCGTRAAYIRHIRQDEDACEACLAANNECGREERAVYSRAKTRAFCALKRSHPALYDVLLEAEQVRERRRNGGRLDPKAKARARQAAYRALARELPEEMARLLAAELDSEQRQAVAS